MSAKRRAEAFQKIRLFDEFNESNDPHGEHDFGSVEQAEEQIFFKIDYYDPDLNFHSEDPSDPEKTVRVMTIMLAHEY